MDPILQTHRPLVVAASAAVPLVACGILALFRDSIANTNAALVLVLLVVAAASTGIRPAGIVAALASAAGFDYFLTEPYNTLTITDRADIETAVLLLLVGAAVTEVALWGRRQQARASREQGYLDGVLGTAATVAAGRSSIGELIDHICQQIVQILQIDTCRFDAGTRSGLPVLDPTGTVTRAGHTDQRCPPGPAHRHQDRPHGAQRRCHLRPPPAHRRDPGRQTVAGTTPRRGHPRQSTGGRPRHDHRRAGPAREEALTSPEIHPRAQPLMSCRRTAGGQVAATARTTATIEPRFRTGRARP